ncbi:MAG TPA: RDD family protein [Microlunatus sp.]|nr:RDD family protein [Microlunatus sp.]
MSEIPVGSPPVPPGRHAAPSGWYPDPVNHANERYWDGWQWSRNTRPSSAAPTAPPQTHQQPYPGQPYGQAPQQNPYGQPPHPQAHPQPYAAKPVPTTADGVPLAGWWWRALAVVIDAVIVGMISSLLTFPIYRRMVQSLTDYITVAFEAASRGAAIPPQPSVAEMISTTDQLILVGVGLLVHTAYIVGFLRWRGATPGKLAVGLKVVPVDQGRSTAQLSWSSAIIRALFWTIPNTQALLVVVRVIDVLMPLWNPKRQALHDLAAKTQVVKIR